MCLVSLITAVVWSSSSNAFSSWRGGGEGGGGECVAFGDLATAAKETYLWPRVDFGIMFGEKSELAAVMLAGNFNEANEVMVRRIPWLT